MGFCFDVNGRLLHKLQLMQNSVAREVSNTATTLRSSSHHTCPDRATLATHSMAHHLETTCVEFPNDARSHARIYR